MSQSTAIREFRDMTDEEVRAVVRELLDVHVPLVKAEHKDRIERGRAWARLLDDHGLAAPSWPIDCGGMDLPIRLLSVYHEEMARSRAPGRIDTALGMV